MFCVGKSTTLKCPKNNNSISTQAVEEHKELNLKTSFHYGPFEHPFAVSFTVRNHINDPSTFLSAFQHDIAQLVVFAPYFLRPLLLLILFPRQVIT